jgi:hypothetical protein
MDSSDVVEQQINEIPEPAEEPTTETTTNKTLPTIKIGNRTITPILNRRGRVITDPGKQTRSQAQLDALARGREALALARKDPTYVSKAGRKLGIKLTVEDQLRGREERNLKRMEKNRVKEEQRQKIVSEAESIIEKTTIERTELEKQRIEEMERIEAIRLHKEEQARFLAEEKKRIASENTKSREEKKAEKQKVILDHIQERIKMAMEEIEITRRLEKEKRRIEKEAEKASHTIAKHKVPFEFDKKKPNDSFASAPTIRVVKPFVLRGREFES